MESSAKVLILGIICLIISFALADLALTGFLPLDQVYYVGLFAFFAAACFGGWYIDLRKKKPSENP